MRWHAPVSDAQQVKTQTNFPTPAELADRTPADRDRAIDVIRIVSLLGVVVGHTVMAISIIRSDVLVWDNLLSRLAAVPGADVDLPDHAAVLLRRRRGVRGIVAPRHQLGRLAAEALHPTVSAGVLLPRVLGGRTDHAVHRATQARLRTDRRRQYSAAVVPRRLCAGAGRDADAVSDHHHRSPRRWCGYGLRSRRGHRRGPAALAGRIRAGLPQHRRLADPGHVRRRLPPRAALAAAPRWARRWRCWRSTSR